MMEWKDIASAVGRMAPIAGGLLASATGGVSTIVGGLVSAALGVANTPDAVSVALQTDPQAAVKLVQIDADKRVNLAGLAVQQRIAELQAASQGVSDANKTMQVEAASEHWPTYSWRPALGFSMSYNLISASTVCVIAYGGVIFLQRDPDTLKYLPPFLTAMAALITVPLPIMGIASWWRGRAQADPAIPASIQLPVSGVK